LRGFPIATARRQRLKHVANETWGIWSLPSYVCFGDSGGGIFIPSHPNGKEAYTRLVANVSDGGIDWLSANDNDRLDTASIQKWIRKTIDEILGTRGRP